MTITEEKRLIITIITKYQQHLKVAMDKASTVQEFFGMLRSHQVEIFPMCGRPWIFIGRGLDIRPLSDFKVDKFFVRKFPDWKDHIRENDNSDLMIYLTVVKHFLMTFGLGAKYSSLEMRTVCHNCDFKKVIKLMNSVKIKRSRSPWKAIMSEIKRKALKLPQSECPWKI